MRSVVINEMLSPGWNYADANTPPGQTVGTVALQSFGFQTQKCALLALPMCPACCTSCGTPVLPALIASVLLPSLALLPSLLVS